MLFKGMLKILMEREKFPSYFFTMDEIFVFHEKLEKIYHNLWWITDNKHCRRRFFHCSGCLKINIADNGSYNKRPKSSRNFYSCKKMECLHYLLAEDVSKG